MSGPSTRLNNAGFHGQWKNNIARDMLRQVGKVATWTNVGNNLAGTLISFPSLDFACKWVKAVVVDNREKNGPSGGT